MKPLGDRVILEEIEQETISSGGIIIPDSVQGYDKPHPKGKIIAVGIKCESNIKEGDVVTYSKNTGMFYEIDGKDYIFIRESHIMYIN